MGRRKIEIKAIKDDRNRSVTFLKRKGGLFKKAHELSVLCSVDVAVIIFGHNKKLYEFSSGNINETLERYTYYGVPHEHKGPEDFAGKKDADDDDDEDMVSPPPESHSSQDHPMAAPQLQNQAVYQHMRNQTPSASPPISNGMPFPPFPHRHSTPQPPQGGSRPSSRNTVRRTSSNLVPQNHPQASHPPQNQNGYAYAPQNAPIYNPQGGAGMPMAPQPGQQPHYQAFQPPAHPHTQPHQLYMQEPRRQSMPPSMPQPDRPQGVTDPSPPQQNRVLEPASLPLPEQRPAPAKSRSIFTPIDDSRSLLAQHWGIGASTAESIKSEPPMKSEIGPRSQSVDVGSVSRNNITGPTAPPPPLTNRAPPAPQRTASASSISDIATPSRTNSGQTNAKRPKLKVDIPVEAEAGNASGSPGGSGGTTGGTSAKLSAEAGHGSGVVLPPPSPSASALLSAGAQGPPNPFARPPPPNPVTNSNSYSSHNIETPISALPSRFVADGLLPSPSSFYPEWGFGRAGADSNMLPSPLNFQTPVVGSGPSFLRDDEGERKRKSPESGDSSDDDANKRAKI
ncbi:MAG: hypothetical protein M1819_001864 [Sarea resinae]|nr:MAG: hypothetical protein M1819_001864 [Sarea resinae]